MNAGCTRQATELPSYSFWLFDIHFHSSSTEFALRVLEIAFHIVSALSLIQVAIMLQDGSEDAMVNVLAHRAVCCLPISSL